MGDVSEMAQTQEIIDSTPEKELDASADTEKLESTERNHLVVLVHGLHGSSTDLIAIKEALEAANLDIVVVKVFISINNSILLLATMDFYLHTMGLIKEVTFDLELTHKQERGLRTK